MSQDLAYDVTGRSLRPLSELLSPDEFPLTDFVPADVIDSLFEGLSYTEARWWSDNDNEVGLVRLAYDGELAIGLPGSDALALVLGSGGPGWTSLLAHLVVGPDLSLTLVQAQAGIRVSPDILRNAQTGQGAEISVAADIRLSPDGIELTNYSGVSLPKSYLCGTEITVEATKVFPVFGPFDRPAFVADDPDFRGLVLENLTVVIPDKYLTVHSDEQDAAPSTSPLVITLDNATIGNTGFTGKVAISADPAAPITGSAFGFGFRFHEFTLDIEQNAIRDLTLGIDLRLEAFEHEDPDTGTVVEKWIGIDLAFHPDGFSAGLSAVQPAGAGQSEDALFTIAYPDVVAVKARTLRLAEAGGVWSLSVSGVLQALFAGGDGWPQLAFQDLTIDSTGRLSLGGGWLTLPSKVGVDFWGFGIELTEIGFGSTQDGGRWVGFSGGMRLVEGMPAGVSVEGLRVTWHPHGDPQVTLNGVGVEFEIPKVLHFAGAVSYQEFLDEQGDTVRRFAGGVKVQLLALDLEVDGSLVIGTDTDTAGTYGFAGAYLTVELPAGIPLGSTGLALYGMAGLAAVQMEPNRADSQEWFDGPDSWYHRDPVGVTDITNRGKWNSVRGSFALGAGVTVGTASDNGHLFSGKFLLLIVLPGPIIMLDGKANLLKERAELGGDTEPMLRSLAVLDARVGTLSIGLDAWYKYAEQGELVDIQGSSHAFFDFNDPGAWYLDIGRKEPETERVRAKLFRLFDASSYFMLSAGGVELGSRVEFRPEPWRAGPLTASIEAWLDAGAAISTKPVHFSGYLWLHGSASLSAFGHGVTVTADASLAGEVFDPYHIKGSFKATLGLPWPLPDISYTFSLEWGPEPTVPPIPVPLKEIAVEHFKTTASWPLPRGETLVPDVDRGDGFLRDNPQQFDELAAPPADNDLQVVPLDARPRITFGRPVHDEARVGFNFDPRLPEYEYVGDPALRQGPLRVRHALTGIRLDKWTGTEWQQVAAKPAQGGLPELSGSWALLPSLPQGEGTTLSQTKLWLWSKTGFDYSRWTSRGYEQWVVDRIPGYPLGPGTVSRWDFASVQTGGVGTSYPHQGLTFSTDCPDGLAIEDIAVEGRGIVRVLRFPLLGAGHIALPAAGADIRLAMPGLRADYVAVQGSSSTHPGEGQILPAMLNGSVVDVLGDESVPVAGVLIGFAPLGRRLTVESGLKDIRECQVDGRRLFVVESGLEAGTGQVLSGLLAKQPPHWGFTLELPGLVPLLTGYDRPQQVVIAHQPDVWHDLIYVLEAGNGGNVMRHLLTESPDGTLTAGDGTRSSGDLVHHGLESPRNMVRTMYSNDFVTVSHWLFVVQATPSANVLALRVPSLHAGTAPNAITVWDWGNDPVGLLADGTETITPGNPACWVGLLYVTRALPNPARLDLLRLIVTIVGDSATVEPQTMVLEPGEPSFLHRFGRAPYLYSSGRGDVQQASPRTDGTQGTWERRVLVTEPGRPVLGAMDGGWRSRLVTWTDTEIGLYELPPIIDPYSEQGGRPWHRTWTRHSEIVAHDAAHGRILINPGGGVIGWVPVPEEAADLDLDYEPLVVHVPLYDNALLDPAGEFLYLATYSTVAQIDVSGGLVDYGDPQGKVREFTVADTGGNPRLAVDASGTVLCVMLDRGDPLQTSIVRLNPHDSTPQPTVVYTGPLGARGFLVDSHGTVAYFAVPPDSSHVQQTGCRLIRADLETGAADVVAEPFLFPASAVWLDTDRTRFAVTGYWRNLYGPYATPMGDEVHVVDLAEKPIQPRLLLCAYYDETGAEQWPWIDKLFALPGGRLLANGSVGNREMRVFRFPDVYLESVTNVESDVALKRLEEEQANWAGQGEVLEPHTTYRLVVQTHVTAQGEKEIDWYHLDQPLTQGAYFRTDGPPALATLSPPTDNPAGTDYRSGLEDLSGYVARTVPPTPAPAAATEPASGPAEHWYRGYDIGVTFNENYVDLMYRAEWRDLGLQLHDNHGPARSEDGCLLALANQWGKAETVDLHRTEWVWLGLLDQTGQPPLTGWQPLKDSHTAAPVGQLGLAPQTRYEARFVPLLLHDDFSRYAAGAGAASGPGDRLGRWMVHDRSGPSCWTVVAEGAAQSRHLLQTQQAESMLLLEDTVPAGGWADHRVSTYLRPPQAGTIGLVIRHDNVGNHYRYVIGPAGAGRRLELVTYTGAATVLAGDAYQHQLDRDYLVTVEAIGGELRVFVEDVSPLHAADATIPAGRPGLYCEVAGGADQARFTDVRVDDYRTDAPVAYRFGFTTSRFTDFYCHLHSYDDGIASVQLDPSVDTGAWSTAGSATATPSDEEVRAYAGLAEAAGAQPGGTAIQATRVDQGGQVVALLVGSPEPLDWPRMTMSLSRATDQTPALSRPAEVKITEVTVCEDASMPNQESVTLLLREPTDLTGYLVAYLTANGEPQEYYRFGAEPPLPAGTRIRVYAGNSHDAPQGEPDVLQRFVATGDDPGEPWLQNGMTLRLLDGQRVVHERLVLSADQFASIAGATLLRSRDGSGFAYVMPAGSARQPGRYRVACEYRCDNTLVDPGSPIYTRGGDKTAEKAAVEVPCLAGSAEEAPAIS